jgi:hypothetical protein
MGAVHGLTQAFMKRGLPRALMTVPIACAAGPELRAPTDPAH